MKVQLERKHPYCSNQLKCVVCNQAFTAPEIRALICTDTGLIHGDLCPACLKSKAAGIRQKLRRESGELFIQADCSSKESLALRQEALELLALSQETLTFPSLLQWVLKRLEVWSQETQELEAARFGNSSCVCSRSRLQMLYDKDESS